jgi:predicted nuclease of predicted toxin-antitoxin system
VVSPPPRLLLIDENVPLSVAKFLKSRGHDVQFVRDRLPAVTADPVIAAAGDKIFAIVVTWDRDFDVLAHRGAKGKKSSFRHLGRISFRCNEAHGRRLIEEWIDLIELHYEKTLRRADRRMIVQIQEASVKFI